MVTTTSKAATTTSSSATTAAASERSKRKYISDLKDILNNAKQLFGDVCWRIDGDDEIIYGHRAILYARANAAFQARFLNPNGSARLQAIMSGSTLNLSIQSPSSPTSLHSRFQQQYNNNNIGQQRSRSVSPGALSVDSRHGGGELDDDDRVQATTTPIVAAYSSSRKKPIRVSGTESAFFKGLLDFFYTAQTPLGEVFTFLFEDSSYIDKEDALDRLSQDLLFMWRSKLFADVSIQLVDAMGDTVSAGDEHNKNSNNIHNEDDYDSDSGTIHEETFFSAHRAILASRCPYFHTICLSPYSDAESTLFTLPSPPFTPASIHFTLAYIYTGSLNLNRTFDLTVAMHLWQSATYLSMDLLLDEVVSRISDMCHDFRACCKTCRMRSKRIFVFASSPEVNDRNLQRRAKKSVLDFFGETWDKEIGELPYSTQKELLIDLCQQTNASNAATAMKGILQLRSKLGNEARPAPWIDHLRSMLIPLEDRIKHFLETAFIDIISSKPFIELIDGIGFSNDVLEKLLDFLVDSLSEKNATSTYEILVGKVLLREEGITTDARGRIEETRNEILAYIRNRWIGIRAQNGFENLENWCLKELSDELEQPVDDLLQSTSTHTQQPITTRTGLRLANTKVHKVENDAFSIVSGPSSLRASVLNRNAARKSTARSTTYTTGRESVFTIDSKSPAASRSRSSSADNDNDNGNGNGLSSVTGVSKARTRTASAGVAGATKPTTTNKIPSAARARTASEKTAPLASSPAKEETSPEAGEAVERGNKDVANPDETKQEVQVHRSADSKESQAASRATAKVVKKPPLVPATTKTVRLRNMSTASRNSLNSKKSTDDIKRPERPESVSSVRSRTPAATAKKTISTGTAQQKTPVSPKSPDLRSPSTSSRPSSVASIRSRISSTPVRKAVSAKDQPAAVTSSTSTTPMRDTARKAADKTPSRPASVVSITNKRRNSVSSTTSVRTTASGRKVTPSKPPSTKVPVPPIPKELPLGVQRTPEAIKASKNRVDQIPKLEEPSIRAAPGSMLKVGIPCVVTIHKTKFRATVRYLGDVYFDSGTFVGVEVPVANNDLPEDLEWNDGTVAQVKYFELVSRKIPTALEARLTAHKSRRPSGTSTDGRSTPNIESANGPTRGLFVRPSQVLYVF